MFSNYNDTIKRMEIKNNLSTITGLDIGSDEVKFFSDVVLELCYCMSVNNGDVIPNKDNIDEKVLNRMNDVGSNLNNTFMTEEQLKVVEDYITSCKLELSNFIYETVLRNFEESLDNCARKINHRLETNEVLIIFARNVYSPPIPKKVNSRSKALKLMKNKF